MDPIQLGALVAGLIVLLLLRVPIAGALLAVGFVGLTLAAGSFGGEVDLQMGFQIALSQVGRVAYDFVASFSLMAIPMFLLMGAWASVSGLTGEAYQAARTWFARSPGGLAQATVMGCGFFAAITGSSLATVSAMGRIAVPEMLQAKYDKGLAAGAVAAGGTLGALIPPSVLMVVYAVFTEQSVGSMLLAGIIPGLLTAVSYMLMIAVRARRNPALAPVISTTPVPWKPKLLAARGLLPFVMLFTAMMAAIYGGLATASEAAAFGAFGTLLLGLVRRRLRWRQIHQGVNESVLETGSVFAIAIGAAVFANFVTYTGLPADLASWVSTLDVPRIWLLLPIVLIYLVLGMFLDPLSTLLLTLPVIGPVIHGLGFDMIWFGVLVVKLLEVGMITPPVGLNVFVLSASVGKKIDLVTMFKGVGWFLVMDMVVIALLIAFPAITLWLPGSMGGF